MLSQEYEYIEIPKVQYDLLSEAIKEMNKPFPNATEFIRIQIKQKKATSGNQNSHRKQRG
jgi:hypothetical protein